MMNYIAGLIGLNPSVEMGDGLCISYREIITMSCDHMVFAYQGVGKLSWKSLKIYLSYLLFWMSLPLVLDQHAN